MVSFCYAMSNGHTAPGSKMAPKALTIIYYAELGKPYAFLAFARYRPRKGKKWRRG